MSDQAEPSQRERYRQGEDGVGAWLFPFLRKAWKSIAPLLVLAQVCSPERRIQAGARKTFAKAAAAPEEFVNLVNMAKAAARGLP